MRVEITNYFLKSDTNERTKLFQIKGTFIEAYSNHQCKKLFNSTRLKKIHGEEQSFNFLMNRKLFEISDQIKHFCAGSNWKREFIKSLNSTGVFKEKSLIARTKCMRCSIAQWRVITAWSGLSAKHLSCRFVHPFVRTFIRILVSYYAALWVSQWCDNSNCRAIAVRRHM